ncbi:MAG: VOC family protein [Proteobacteria bacterium]|nr:VOC family protein [Pseudomonadota bacterium]
MNNENFEYRGVNHVALVCKDMAKTVEFYDGVLGMKLVKTLDLPGGSGQHFFFDAGSGTTIAFFWFPDAPAAAPGIASQNTRGKSIATAHASMNHLAITIPLEKFDEYAERLRAKGLDIRIINHADNDHGYTEDVTEETWIRSMYFRDPDGIAMELAAYTRAFTAKDIAHQPARFADREKYLAARASSHAMKSQED